MQISESDYPMPYILLAPRPLESLVQGDGDAPELLGSPGEIVSLLPH